MPTESVVASPSGSTARLPFGRIDGQDVHLYAMRNASGMTLKVATYGAIVTSLEVPDRAGRLVDVVLGHDRLEGYLAHSPYFGATVGRVANRIRDARFELGGKTYHLASNNAPHHLHGGAVGWDKVLWNARELTWPKGVALALTRRSPDGEEGYPGNVEAETVYALTDDCELRIEMSARTDATTIVNMAHHTYWNLAGSGSIAGHHLVLHAKRYTPGDPMVPTGVEQPVEGTAFDFTTAKPIGRDLVSAGGSPVGYDHNFVVDGDPTALRPVARLADPGSGRVMTIAANQPGVQFYSGNFLDGTIVGRSGRPYRQHDGLCLETQGFPNAVNVPAWRSQVLLKPGQPYKHTMIHRFTAE